MTDLDLTQLRKIAVAATPGPWAWHSRQTVDGDQWAVFSPRSTALANNNDGWAPDAAHIAAFDPPTVLALLDRLEAAEAAIQKVRDLHQPVRNNNNAPFHVCAHDNHTYPCPTIQALGGQK